MYSILKRLLRVIGISWNSQPLFNLFEASHVLYEVLTEPERRFYQKNVIGNSPFVLEPTSWTHILNVENNIYTNS